MRIYAKIKTTFEKTHRWKECNLKGVKFLKNLHHHIFEVVVLIEQRHTERDIEYLTFKRWLDRKLKKLRIENDSCEKIAQRIKKIITKEYSNREVQVEVLEDGHYGAIVK